MKCVGCGVKLQTDDPNKEGYISEIHIIENGEQVYCKRCFDIIHYNRRYVPMIDNGAYFKKMQKIALNNPQDVVILLVDVLDIYSGFSSDIAKIIGNLKVIVLINKIDLMPKKIKLPHIEDVVRKMCKKYNLNLLSVYFISSKSKKNIELVLRKIDKLRINKYSDKPRFNNCYVVGNASVGKSTFINSVKEICYGENQFPITTSDQFQTTMDMLKIELGNKFYLYDTPGIINKNSFNAYLDYESVKILTPKSYLKVRTYQLNSMQTIFMGGLVRLDFIEGENISASFFVSNDLYLHRTKLSNASLLFDTQQFKLLVPPLKEEEQKRLNKLKTTTIMFENNEFYDIIIPGIGFIHLKGNALKLNITLPEQISFKKVQSML